MMASEHIRGANASINGPSLASDAVASSAAASGCACEAWAPAPPAPPMIEAPNTICGRVECHEGDDDTITELILYGHQMSGTIPTEIGRFSLVEYLGLGTNELSGTIPTELAKLTRMTTMHLWNNRLSGSIPTQLGKLTRAETCNLARPRDAVSVSASYDSTCGGNQFACPVPPELTPSCAASASCTDRLLPCAPSPHPPPSYPPLQHDTSSMSGVSSVSAATVGAAAAGAVLALFTLACLGFRWRLRRRHHGQQEGQSPAFELSKA